MSIERYDAGETGKISGSFKDSDGVVVPGTSISAITLTLTDAATGNVVNSRSAQNVNGVNGGTLTAGGAFTFVISAADTTPLAGAFAAQHVAEFTATFTTASQAGAQTAKFTHRMLCFAGGYALPFCTFEDIAAFLGNGVDEDARLTIEVLIDGFTRRVERETGRTFRRQVDAVEYFSPMDHQYAVRVSRWPIEAVTSLKESLDGDFSQATAADAGEFAILDEGVIRKRWVPFFEGIKSVEVTFTGGLARDPAGVPGDVRVAAIHQVAHWFQRKDAPGVQSQSAGQGSAAFQGEGDLLPSSKAIVKLLSPVGL